jgi:hypothetical protein
MNLYPPPSHSSLRGRVGVKKEAKNEKKKIVVSSRNDLFRFSFNGACLHPGICPTNPKADCIKAFP